MQQGVDKKKAIFHSIQGQISLLEIRDAYLVSTLDLLVRVRILPGEIANILYYKRLMIRLIAQN
jgi:hypothetical protein